MDQDQKEEHLKDARARLELELCRVHSKLKAPATGKVRDAHPPLMGLENPYEYTSHTFASHALLLLSDSALPLGSFAFSSGLESFLAHHPARPIPSIQRFLSLSLYSVASTVLPYLLAAYRDPTKLVHLDDTLDACTLCPVAHRASVAQGSALLTLWERAFRPTADPNDRAALALAQLAKGLKGVFSPDEEAPNGHFAPVWAVITAAMGISVKDSAYAFLLNHAKAVTSAAVRASMVGPYQAQGVLAGNWLRKEIAMCLEENWEEGMKCCIRESSTPEHLNSDTRWSPSAFTPSKAAPSVPVGGSMPQPLNKQASKRSRNSEVEFLQSRPVPKAAKKARTTYCAPFLSDSTDAEVDPRLTPPAPPLKSPSDPIISSPVPQPGRSTQRGQAAKPSTTNTTQPSATQSQAEPSSSTMSPNDITATDSRTTSTSTTAQLQASHALGLAREKFDAALKSKNAAMLTVETRKKAVSDHGGRVRAAQAGLTRSKQHLAAAQVDFKGEIKVFQEAEAALERAWKLLKECKK